MFTKQYLLVVDGFGNKTVNDKNHFLISLMVILFRIYKQSTYKAQNIKRYMKISM
jgi:hypothetical protein